MKHIKHIVCLAFALLLTADLFAQVSVSGRITDSDGQAIIGATVLVKGTTTGTSSVRHMPEKRARMAHLSPLTCAMTGKQVSMAAAPPASTGPSLPEKRTRKGGRSSARAS